MLSQPVPLISYLLEINQMELKILQLLQGCKMEHCLCYDLLAYFFSSFDYYIVDTTFLQAALTLNFTADPSVISASVI